MLNYNDKPLNELSLEDTILFEKEIAVRLSQATKANMSDHVTNTIMGYLQEIRNHKAVAVSKYKVVKENDQNGVINIGEIESESTDSDE